MLAYLKLKSVDEELYETDFLSKLKEKNTKFSKLQYWMCYIFFQLVVKLKYLCNIITVKQIYQSYLFILPFSTEEKQKKGKKMKKCMKKVTKFMEKYQVDTLVLSEEVKEIEEEKLPINRAIHFLDGKGLKPYLIREMLEYIIKKQGSKTEVEDVYLCIKEIKPIFLDNLFYLAPYFKTINIITPNIAPMQRLADKIERKENGIITVTNNKKKSLKKAEFIVNFDFTEKEMKKYTIYRRAIILSIEKEEWNESIGFDGIQVQQLGIDTSLELKDFFDKYYLLEKNNITTLYESLIDKQQGFIKVKEQMQKYQVRIVKLYGRKGEIQEKEYVDKAS